MSLSVAQKVLSYTLKMNKKKCFIAHQRNIFFELSQIKKKTFETEIFD